MTARTSISETDRKDGLIQAYPMVDGEVIYKGSTAIIDATSGLLQTNDGTTITLANGDIFAGIAVETVNNSTNDQKCRVYRTGTFLVDISDTIAQANVGDEVYLNNVTDDSTLTITSDTANPQITVGQIVEFVSANKAYISIDNYVGNVGANGA